MRGISTSSTITSGHWVFIRAMANIGSATAASTVMEGSLASWVESTCRTTAESSTMRTLVFFIVMPARHR